MVYSKHVEEPDGSVTLQVRAATASAVEGW